MEHKRTSIEEFLKLEGQTVDVRSPKEFEQGHIPDAWNLPLFSDSERAQVGLAYQLQGVPKAVEVGLKFVGPKLSDWVRQIRKKKMSCVKVYCARGGMRSQSLLWLLNFCRIPAISLKRGYKNYRNWVLNAFEKDYTFHCIGGNLGSGKSDVLDQLRKKEQVIDLKKIAHYPKNFLNQLPLEQPTNEQFENELAHLLSACDSKQPIWLEDESHLLGKCSIPNSIYTSMQAAPLYFVQKKKEERVRNILNEYQSQDTSSLIEMVSKLQKKLGFQESKIVLDLIGKNLFFDAIEHLLNYYDKFYADTLKKRAGPLILLNDEIRI
jgi:tRNA 2-selenouridine synthase